MRFINVYRHERIEGAGVKFSREVRAVSRSAAIRELKCYPDELTFVERSALTVLERRVLHAARTPIHSWRLDQIVDHKGRRIRP